MILLLPLPDSRVSHGLALASGTDSRCDSSRDLESTCALRTYPHLLMETLPAILHPVDQFSLATQRHVAQLSAPTSQHQHQHQLLDR